MGTATAPAKPNPISVDPKSKIPLYVQLHEEVVRAITDGTFPAGSRLPGQRELANALNISRNTIRRAFQKLVEDGFLVGDANSGFIAAIPALEQTNPRHLEKAASIIRNGPASRGTDNLSDLVPTASTSVSAPSVKTPGATAPEQAPLTMAPPEITPAQPEKIVFRRAAALEQIDATRLHTPGEPRPFRPGFPATGEFPLEIWEDLRVRLLRERAPELLDFTGIFGYLPLREAIASRLRSVRGVRCLAEQVIITAGAQQALNLIVSTLVSPGDVVGVEEPGYYAAKAAFLRAGARVVPLLVDEEGLIVPDAKKQNSPSVIYSTPTNQFPLGVMLPLARRLALLDYACQNNTWIVEDDSDGDFSYCGRPVPSLQGSDHQNRVLYVGTTGKSLFPALEIGYVVVPLTMMETFAKTKEISGGQPCVIDQATLGLFIKEGHFERHVQRVSVIYHQRLQALSQSVETELDGFVQLQPAQGGLHAVGWLNRNLDENRIADCANSTGLELPPLSAFGKTALVRPGVVFGFASFSEEKIRQSIRALGQALRSGQKQRALLTAPNDSPHSEKAGFFRRLFAPRR